MLPRTDILINRIRQESDTEDENSLSDFVMTQYLNDAQRTIQNIIFQSDQLNNVFTTYIVLTAVNGQVEYDLPSNVYAENSIISVWTLGNNNRPGIRYDKLSYGEQSLAYGYSVRNRKIVFNHAPQQDVLVIYNYRLPLMSLRAGGISGVASQVISMTDILDNWENVAEYVSIVDKYGTQIQTQLYIDSFSDPSLTVEGDITSVTSSHFVTIGGNSSTHSSLPEECETLLKVFTQRKVLAHINSKKVANSDIFTKEERQDIEELFADKHSDIEYPVIVDYDYLDF
jgi:hypothetical protein